MKGAANHAYHYQTAGLAILLLGICGLFLLSFMALRRGGSAPAVADGGTSPAPAAPPGTRVVLGESLREAEVEDLLGGDFAHHRGSFRHEAEGVSGGKAEGTISPAMSFNCWDPSARAEAFLEDDPERKGARRLVIRNLGGGRPSAQFYTWKKLPVLAKTKYILACEYKTAGTGVINLDSTRFAPRKVEMKATGGQWKKLQIGVDRARAGEVGVFLQYFGATPENPIYLRSLNLWRVK
jgi:hypothetical protein